MNRYEPASTVSVEEIIRHFWARKLVIIILPAVLTIGAWIYFRYFAEEVFRSTAVLMIRTKPTDLREGSRFRELESPVYRDILRSDQILNDVLIAARQRFPEDFSGLKFENFTPNFRVASSVTRDTSVVTTYAPTITLSVEIAGREQTKFVMDEWVRLCIERFGQLRYAEANSVEAAINTRLQEQQQIIAEAEGEFFMLNEKDTLRRGRMASIPFDDPRNLELLIEAKENHQAMEIARQRLAVAREQQSQLRGVMATLTAEVLKLTDPLNPELSGDLILLSAPVMPEYRIAPRRTVLAVAVGASAFFFLLVVFFAEFFLRRSLR